MKNTISGKYLLLAILFSSLASIQSVNAAYYNDNDAYCGDPLICGSAIFQIQGGVAPTRWRNRGEFSLVSCNATGAGQPSAVVPVFELPKFNKLFHVPFIIGGHLGYALNNNLEVYAEVNYRRAKAKDGVVINGIPLANQTQTLNVNFSFADAYKAIDFYGGARYYWGGFFCNTTSFFLGGQFGLTHHKSLNANFNISTGIGNPLSATNIPFAHKNTVPAGGANLGLQWCAGCGLSVGLAVEILATCAPRVLDTISPAVAATRSSISLADCSSLPILLPTDILPGSLGSELYFPVTLTVRYSF